MSDGAKKESLLSFFPLEKRMLDSIAEKIIIQGGLTISRASAFPKYSTPCMVVFKGTPRMSPDLLTLGGFLPVFTRGSLFA